ncbi:MAG TPA: tetratricopeptide repeat protein, partial [Fimbriimonadaceae bacterium]|nr:tetratricopeptide repeat protein [Fimbriimonadaceae bacterium]
VTLAIDEGVRHNPAATESAFRKVLADEGDVLPAARRAELLSQIGRTLGLQRRFDEAHEILKEAFELAGDDPIARCRCRLEKGRAFNSAGNKEKALECFTNALAEARRATAGSGSRDPDFYVVDALHMLAIAAQSEEQMRWHREALSVAEASANPATRNWMGSLTNNLAWTLHDAGQYEEALEVFQKALAFRREQGNPKPIHIAKWSVARCMRSLGRIEEALAIQRELLASGESDGFVEEEMGECLLALGREDEAKPHFAKAYEMLSKVDWMVANEKDRLNRLRKLS